MAAHRRSGLLVPLLIPLVVLTACDSPSEPRGDDPPDGGVDLAALFAPPDASERAAVEEDWASRSPGAEGVVEEHESELPTPGGRVRIRILSHLVDGHRHVGAIVEPAEPPAGLLPVLVYGHGGESGVSVEEALLAAATLGVEADDYVLVVPSFRSEPLRFGERRWRSEGTASPWNRDVDDALALVEVALATTPFADEDRLGVVGISRGGAVGLLMGIRDARIRAVVSYFAPTDFFGPFTRDVFDQALAGAPPDLPGVGFLSTHILAPLEAGILGVDEVRLELLRRSAARFADRLPAVQVHHGTADDVVPVEEAEHLTAVMGALGRGPPDFEAYIYTGAGHNPFTMPTSVPRVRAFLASHLEPAAPSLVATTPLATPD